MPLQTFDIVKRISAESQQSMIDYFTKKFDSLLEDDVSTYAKGRRRLWLEAEPTLVRNFTLTEAIQDERTWTWLLKNVWPGADLGLLSRGPVGIKMHRDATYAGWEAYGLNLGETVTFGYQECYGSFKYGNQDDSAPITEVILEPGDVFRFNPKNPHGILSEITDARWAINLWCLK
jgi:hypothetical protein